jgi:hypothetical protein
MTETEETRAGVEYWDRVVAGAKRGTNAQTIDRNCINAETVERNLDRAEESEERDRAARRSRRR